MHMLNISADFTGVDYTSCGTMLPKAGTVVLTGTGTVGTLTINAMRTVTFGPNCGDAQIE
jgi:hypothetical protein